MRAVRYAAFGQLPAVEDVPDPEPTDGGVVIEVRATGLCRSDWHGWAGHDADITPPHIPGHEFAGVVRSVGAGVKRVRIGDRVVVPFVLGCGDCDTCRAGAAQVCPNQWQPGFNGPGSFAELVAVPAADFNAVTLPPEVSFEVAAGLGCRFATAYRGVVDVAKVQAGERVVVVGCGGVGLAAVMVAASLGAEVLAVDVSSGALEVAASVGATHLVDAAESIADEVRLVWSGGADVAIDALGSIPTARAASETLGVHGRHLQIGLLPPAVVADRASVPMHLVIARELRVLGSHGMAAADYPRMLADIAAGRLQPERLLGRTISLDEAPAALVAMGDGSMAVPGVTIIRP
ncbi:alcohol dehydrogenase catalytic domain-containing protein [Aestuariimicrobium kwangyangense]|uniref:alcohol dehydrogenase catalytic domain-containing protein n=1 Tax=Aestuariimicrobium kwangyangense TaxID=396389 RepID=UPI0003B6A077|nr:alcohol dehydrogenase catalytic domain-containing protein [Aestuariimicrobium kwangyangense]